MTRNTAIISQFELTKLLGLYKKLGKDELPQTINPHNGQMETLSPDEYNLVSWPREVQFLGCNAGGLYNLIYNSPASPADRLKETLKVITPEISDYNVIYFCRNYVPGYFTSEKYMGECINAFLESNLAVNTGPSSNLKYS